MLSILSERPSIDVVIRRTPTTTWERFKRHHYMSQEINRGAVCFVGFFLDQPVCFTAVIPFPMSDGTASRREHRTVCLPDFQGVGIGNRMSEAVAAMWTAKGDRYFSTTANPAMIAHRAKSSLWHMLTPPRMTTRNKTSRGGTIRKQNFGKAGQDRLMASFEFVGPPDPRGFLE